MRRNSRRLCLLLLLACLCRVSLAHPMGNFSVNHYSRLTLEPDRIEVRYILDLAEIPAYQELQQASLTANPADPDDPAVQHYLAAKGEELGHGLSLIVDGHSMPLHLSARDILFPPGAGGLPTLKMAFTYQAAYPGELDRSHVAIAYADHNYPGHSGWKEIVALDPAGTLARSSVPSTDQSAALSNYPTDLLRRPPQDLEATLEASLPAPAFPASRTRAAGTPAPAAHPLVSTREVRPSRQNSALSRVPSIVHAAPGPPPFTSPAHTTKPLQANQQQTPRNRFTELITAQHLGPWFLFTAALIAFSLGGLHALEPGHGKTIVAAYLVGSRGTPRHAVLLGVIVTVAHTAGVFALGAITLFASRYIVPEQLYPWLGLLSGLTIAGLGVYMLLRRLTGTATDHSHLPGESTGLHLPFASRGARTVATPTQPAAAPGVSRMQLLTLGITGGVIPCPAALIVLLSAFALHRVALGLFLIVAFSMGLATVLIGFGLLMIYARRSITRLRVDGPLTRRWLPVLSSAFITVLGLIVAFQAIAATHLTRALFTGLLSRERLGPVLFLTGLGLVLGMRHSTDPDHVVAISTIVSKQRSIRNAAFIGSVWGLGHTIMIFAVGALIILAGIKIPPRVGLAMEFSVALMLILLGSLNLTGVTQRLMARYTPGIPKANDISKANEIPKANDTPPALSSAVAPARQGRIERFGIVQCVRPLIIGLVHGLAGSAAVALLVLSTIHNPVWATIYLLIFGFGTVLGMMIMTAAIAVPLTYAGDRFSNLGRYFGITSGVISMCFGLFLVYQLGFVGGLFTSHPHWTPQ